MIELSFSSGEYAWVEEVLGDLLGPALMYWPVCLTILHNVFNFE